MRRMYLKNLKGGSKEMSMYGCPVVDVLETGVGAFNQCRGRCNYGDFCYKHRSLYLLEGGEIHGGRFTGLAKDYLIRDLRNYCKRYRHLFGVVFHVEDAYERVDTYLKGRSKSEIFEIVAEMINRKSVYDSEKCRLNVVKIQSVFRGFQERKKFLCNNTEDFFTFERMNEIPDIYYFSYKDIRGFRWGFDIRSLKKLVEMRFTNPYTTEPIPPKVMERIESRIHVLICNGVPMDIVDERVKDKTTTIKQGVVDLFSKIEQSGYPCDISWFLELDIPKLRELYKQLEDIWNYRSQLTREMKREICPPNGRVFSIPIVVVQNYPTKEMLQECLLTEVSKFSRSPEDANQKLGYMYFMIGLGYVSEPCFQAHQDWLSFIN